MLHSLVGSVEREIMSSNSVDVLNVSGSSTELLKLPSDNYEDLGFTLCILEAVGKN